MSRGYHAAGTASSEMRPYQSDPGELLFLRDTMLSADRSWKFRELKEARTVATVGSRRMSFMA